MRTTAVLIGPQCGLIDADRSRHIALGILQPVLAELDLAQRGQHGGNIRMIGAKALFADGERSSQQRFGFGGFALGLQNLAKHDKSGGRHGRLSPCRSFSLAFELSRQGYGFAVAAFPGQRGDALHQREHVLGTCPARRHHDARKEYRTKKLGDKSPPLYLHAATLRSPAPAASKGHSKM